MELAEACGDETVIGAAFYLMEPIDGFNPTRPLIDDGHTTDPSVSVPTAHRLLNAAMTRLREETRDVL